MCKDCEEYENHEVTQYWLENYLQGDLCSLCANTGWIDTTGIKSPAGVEAGRHNLCICPNGQAMRYSKSVLSVKKV